MITSIHLRRAAWLCAVLLGIALALPAGRASAQDQLCFPQLGLPNCISGRFLQFWRQNGGVPVFGYPLSAEQLEQTPSGTFTCSGIEHED